MPARHGVDSALETVIRLLALAMGVVAAGLLADFLITYWHPV